MSLEILSAAASSVSTLRGAGQQDQVDDLCYSDSYHRCSALWFISALCVCLNRCTDMYNDVKTDAKI